MTNALPFLPDEDADALREAFAKLWAKHPTANLYTLGQAVFKDLPHGVVRSAQAVELWKDDPAVIEAVRRYAVSGDVPKSKEELAAHFMAIHNAAKDDRTRLDALTRVGEAMGFLGVKGAPAPGTTNVTNNIDNRKVEYVTVYGDEEASQKAAMAQQRRLIDEAAASMQPVSDEAKGAYRLMAPAS